MQNGIVHHRGRLAAESALPSRHFVKDKAKREDVAACVQLLPSHLLGRHVARRAHRGPSSRQGLVDGKLANRRSPMQRRRVPDHYLAL